MTPPARQRATLVWLAVIGSILAGSLTAVQSFINGQLGRELGNGIVAAWISFLGGMIVVLLIFVFTPRSRGHAAAIVGAVRDGQLRWWMLTGGLAGAIFVVFQGVTVGVLGVALFTLGVVAGQIGAGIVFDRLGLAPGTQLNATWLRIAGGTLAVVAVGVAVWSQVSAVSAVWLIVLPFLGGVVIAWQGGVNGRVNRAASSSVVTATLNYAVGLAALTVAVLVILLTEGFPTSWPTEWWMYSGGPWGLVFVALASYFVRIVGVLVLGMASIAGQLIASLLLDALAPVARAPITIGLIIGTVLAFFALVIASWREFRPAPVSVH